MGILTRVNTDIDEQDQVIRVFAVTKFNINNRAALNRVAGRVSMEAGVGQRVLVASAYEDLDIDLVWNRGLGGRIKPEDKFEDAKKIDYTVTPIEKADVFTDIMPVYLKEFVEFEEFRGGEYLHVWEIPFEISSRR